MPSVSAYQAALGERFNELDPQLQRYFAAIPAGSIGVGTGVFSEFGTPRSWLWPLIRLFQTRGVLYAGFARDVPFRVLNRTVGNQQIAQRELSIGGSTWIMADAVAAVGNRVVDQLGTPRTAAASFDLAVRDGALTMQSRAVGLQLGRVRVRVPRVIAPRIRLTERVDEFAPGGQRVELTIDVPVVGRIYAYTGTFTYEIVREQDLE